MKKYLFTIPDQKRIRIIVSTDCKNEADGQFALVRHLLTPKFMVNGIVAVHFDKNLKQYGKGHTAAASREEAMQVMALIVLECPPPVYMGFELPLENESTPAGSEGADFIISEEMREVPHPGRAIRVYNCVNDRLILNDFFQK